MNLFSILKVAFVFVCTLLVLLVTLTVVLLNVGALQRFALSTSVSMATDLNAQIGEVTSLQLWPDASIVVKDLRITSGDGGSPELFSAKQLSLELIPWSNFNSQSALINAIEIDSARVDLSHLNDSDAGAGFQGMSDEETTFEFLSLINRLNITDSQIVYQDDDQNIVLNVKHCEGETLRGRTEISLVGDLNGLPLDLTGFGEIEKSLAEGSLSWGKMSGTFSSGLNLSSSVPTQQFELYMTAPSSKPLLDLIGAIEMRDGKFSLQVNVDRSTVNTDIVVDADLGEFKMDLSSRVDDMTTLNDFEFSYRAIGPSLEEAGALFNFLDFPSQPFSMNGNVKRQDKQVDISRSILTIGDGSFIVQGSLPNYPLIDGWQLELEGDEIGLDMLRPFAGRCTLPNDAFRWRASLRTNELGDETLNFLLKSPQRRFQMEGAIGPAPGYDGTSINVTSEGIQLSDLGNCMGLADLSEETTTISASLTKKGEDWSLSPLTLVTDSLAVDVTVVLDQLPGPDSVQISARVEIDDLGNMFDPSERTLFQSIDGASLRFETKIDGTTADLDLVDLSFFFNDQPGTISGRLGDISTLQQLKLLFEFSGEDIWKSYRQTGVGRLPFKVSGKVDSVSAGWAISDVELKAGNADLTLNGIVSNHDNYVGSSLELGLQGSQLFELLPPTLTKGAPALPVSLELVARYEEVGVEVSTLRGTLGVSKLVGDGFVAFPPDYRGTRGNLSVEGSSTGEILELFGYESNFLDRPFSMTAQFDGTYNEVSVEQLNLSFGESDLSGKISIDWSDVPYVDVDLRSGYLYIPYFFPKLEKIAKDISSVLPGDMSQYEDELTEDELSERLIEDAELSTGWLNRLEGEFTLNAEEVFFSNTTSMGIDVDFGLTDGTLTTRRANVHGDSFVGNADIEITQMESGASYLVDIDSTRLPLFSLFSGDSDIDRDASYRARLTSSGDSVHDLLGNMDGKILYKGSGGTLHTNQLNAFFGDFFSQLTSRLLGQNQTSVKVECTAAAMVIVDGQLEFNPALVLRTDRVDVLARGKIDLAEESLNLVLNSRSRKGVGISALKTVSPRSRVAGTFAHPQYVFDATGAVASGTAAMATGGLSVLASGLKDRFLARRANPCDVIYQQAINDKALNYAELIAP